MIYDTICHGCATSLGWTPVTMTDSRTGEQIPRPVGMWEGKCDACGLVKGVCASRDYDKPGMRRLTGREALEALYMAKLDSESPPGEEEIEDEPMERTINYQVDLRMVVGLAFDEGDATPDDPARIRELLAENIADILTNVMDVKDVQELITGVQAIEDSSNPAVPAKYVSVWDDSGEIETDCMYDPVTKRAYDIQSSELSPEGECVDEFVRLADGTELRDHSHGVTFDY
jgi:hypothetical protein